MAVPLPSDLVKPGIFSKFPRAVRQLIADDLDGYDDGRELGRFFGEDLEVLDASQVETLTDKAGNAPYCAVIGGAVAKDPPSDNVSRVYVTTRIVLHMEARQEGEYGSVALLDVWEWIFARIDDNRYNLGSGVLPDPDDWPILGANKGSVLAYGYLEQTAVNAATPLVAAQNTLRSDMQIQWAADICMVGGEYVVAGPD